MFYLFHGLRKETRIQSVNNIEDESSACSLGIVWKILHELMLILDLINYLLDCEISPIRNLDWKKVLVLDGILFTLENLTHELKTAFIFRRQMKLSTISQSEV